MCSASVPSLVPARVVITHHAGPNQQFQTQLVLGLPIDANPYSRSLCGVRSKSPRIALTAGILFAHRRTCALAITCFTRCVPALLLITSPLLTGARHSCGEKKTNSFFFFLRLISTCTSPASSSQLCKVGEGEEGVGSSATGEDVRRPR